MARVVRKIISRFPTHIDRKAHGRVRWHDDVGVLLAALRSAYFFFPPTPGTNVICVIHAAIWRSSRSSTDVSSTPRVDFPIATGVTGGTGTSVAPFTNMSLTCPSKPPQQKHQPSPTP